MKLDRTCYKCGTDFVLKPTQKSTNICRECRNEYSRNHENKKSKVALDGYKDPYPYNEKAKIQRFKEIRNQLDEIKDREEWKQFFKDQLYKLETDDIAVLKWIYDRRNQEAVQASIEKKRETEEKKYEDTRESQQSNKSWFD